jgi:heme exporter protein D
MATFVWTVFAVAVLIGIFVVCVAIVVAGVRLLEGWLGRRAPRERAHRA